MKILRGFLILFLTLILISPVLATDIKVSDLPEDTSPTGDDLIMTVNDPTGTPASRKAKLQNLSLSLFSGKGNLTELTSSVLTIGGGTNAIIGSGTTIQVKLAATAQSGYLSSTDWNTFNNKQSAITPGALTKTNDTNVTLTLGGTPTTALLQATSLTLGWTGTLADSRIASATTWNAKESALTFQYSLSRSVNTVNLFNDSASPGNSKYYGTDSVGTRGFFTLPSGGTPGGSDTQVQFNDGGVFGGELAFIWNKTNDLLNLGPIGTASGRLGIQIGSSGSYATGTGIKASDIELFESHTPGPGNYYIGNVIYHRKSGGDGHRESLHVILETSGNSNSDMLCPIIGIGKTADTGHVFGINGYGWVSAGANAAAEAVGGEFDTDVRSNITRKVGLQIADVATSTGYGSVYDSGLLITKQAGGRGFDSGIRVDTGSIVSWLLYYGTIFQIDVNGNMFMANARSIYMKDNPTGTNKSMMFLSSNNDLGIGDGLSGAGHIWMNIDGTTRQVTAGANNSCGTARCLTIPNL